MSSKDEHILFIIHLRENGFLFAFNMAYPDYEEFIFFIAYVC